MRKYHHKVEEVKFIGNILSMKIDGKRFEFDISRISKNLLKASAIERNTFEISPSGYGIHWPLIDEDLSIDGLLGIKHTPPKAKKRVTA